MKRDVLFTLIKCQLHDMLLCAPLSERMTLLCVILKSLSTFLTNPHFIVSYMLLFLGQNNLSVGRGML